VAAVVLAECSGWPVAFLAVAGTALLAFMFWCITR
jgi:hypothetical protein